MSEGLVVLVVVLLLFVRLTNVGCGLGGYVDEVGRGREG